MSHAVRFEDVSKQFRLGALRAGSLRGALSTIIRRNNGGDGADTFWALKNVSFAVNAGESVGLVGPNGAGKSTTLRLIAGITRPTSGRVAVNGRIASLLELGAGFHPELTGRENVYLYGSILGIKRVEMRQIFAKIVEFAELEQFLDTPIKRYSSGMYVRLAFAVAAHVDPDILLVDEVLAVGDAGFRQKCMDRMKQLQASGVTLIFVSHNSHMVQSTCNRVIYLSRGQLLGDGEAEEVLRLYEHDLRSLASTTADQSAAAAPHSAGDIEIRAIRITDRDDHPATEFDYSDGARIRVTYRAPEAINAPILHVRLYRDDGVPCFTVRSNQPNARLDDLVLHGEGSFTLNLATLQLYGGLYRAEIAIADGSRPLALGFSDWFQVDGPGNIDIANERLGIYVPEATWELDNHDNAQGKPVDLNATADPDE